MLAPEQPPSFQPIPTQRPNTAPALAALADLAPTLKEAELRVLLELTRRALSEPTHSIRVSSRDLAAACRAGRPNVQRALDTLAARCLITVRQGNATRASSVQVNFLETVRIALEDAKVGGFGTEPPHGQARLHNEASLDLFRSQGGSETEPPPSENRELSSPASTIDVSIETDVFDRVLSANPKNVDPELLAHSRAWLHGYMTKLGRDPHAHPPDDKLVAQFLAIADLARLERLLMGGPITEPPHPWVAPLRGHPLSLPQVSPHQQKTTFHAYSPDSIVQ